MLKKNLLLITLVICLTYTQNTLADNITNEPTISAKDKEVELSTKFALHDSQTDETYEDYEVLPISFIISPKLHRLYTANSDLKIKLMASTTLLSNIDLLYNRKLTNHLSISFGLGLCNDKYYFETNKNIKTNKDKKFIFRPAQEIVFSGSTDADSIVSSSIGLTFLEIIIPELRFNLNKHDLKKGFFAAIAGRAGMRIKSYEQIEYRETTSSGRKKIKTNIIQDNLGLQRARYGGSIKIGYGRFSISYTHYFSNIFNTEEWEKTNIKATSGHISANVDIF
jgi:hypothetical protein